MIRYIILMFIPFYFLYAQENEALVTDRPDQTESAETVPKNSWQIETGMVYQGDKTSVSRSDVYNIATTLIRYGLNKRIELRVGSDYTIRENDIEGFKSQISGVSGLLLATKLDLTDEKQIIPNGAMLLNLILPVGGRELTGEKADLGLLFIAEYTLTKSMGLGFNFGPEWEESEYLDYYYSMVIGKDLSDLTGIFVEFFGQMYPDNQPDISADAGLTYLINSNLQIDISAGYAFSENTPDFFVNAGVSIRFLD